MGKHAERREYNGAMRELKYMGEYGSCSVCNRRTVWACSDCRDKIEEPIYLCNKKTCRDEHEKRYTHGELIGPDV
jgi:hypothetical protein